MRRKHVVERAGNIVPIENHGDLAVIYCFLFLFVAAKGAGVWSFDSLRFRYRAPAADTGSRNLAPG